MKITIGLGIPTMILFLVSCSKGSDFTVDNRFSLLIDHASFTNVTDTVCQMTLRYYLNSAYNKQELADANFFTFDTYGGGFQLDSSSISLTLTETSRQKMQGHNPTPYSMLFLMDKTLNDGGISETPALEFEKQFYSFFSTRQNYEITLAAFATGNNTIPGTVKFFETTPLKNVKEVPDDVWNYLFSFNGNQGQPDLAAALSSSMDYMARSSTFQNRFIFVFTNQHSRVPDTATIDSLVQKAVANNIRICIMSTIYPDAFLYDHLTLCNRTNGFYFSDLSSTLLNHDFDMEFAAIDRTMSTDEAYESTFDVKASGAFFKRIRWALPTINVTFADYSEISNYIVYER